MTPRAPSGAPAGREGLGEAELAELGRARHLTLDGAVWQYQRGYLSESEWKAYAHAWQRSAPRFAVRACQCDACVRDYPEPEYRELGTGVATDWSAP